MKRIALVVFAALLAVSAINASLATPPTFDAIGCLIITDEITGEENPAQ